ncbi:hypothetical protein BC832DRAFT_299361 [Gaertneriomyces semiglobifer]|nr:hypothetical protein BC832DRAFT_299361 [Gaertneriomyces semiglobifer]
MGLYKLLLCMCAGRGPYHIMILHAMAGMLGTSHASRMFPLLFDRSNVLPTAYHHYVKKKEKKKSKKDQHDHTLHNNKQQITLLPGLARYVGRSPAPTRTTAMMRELALQLQVGHTYTNHHGSRGAATRREVELNSEHESRPPPRRQPGTGTGRQEMQPRCPRRNILRMAVMPCVYHPITPSYVRRRFLRYPTFIV